MTPSNEKWFRQPLCPISMAIEVLRFSEKKSFDLQISWGEFNFPRWGSSSKSWEHVSITIKTNNLQKNKTANTIYLNQALIFPFESYFALASVKRQCRNIEVWNQRGTLHLLHLTQSVTEIVNTVQKAIKCFKHYSLAGYYNIAICNWIWLNIITNSMNMDQQQI